MPRISVVLPCYRTAQYLPELYQRLVAALESCSDGFEIILVDDGSPDDCWPQIERLAAKDERVKGIHLSRRFVRALMRPRAR
jgi:glycosyltransferase involved in cell wall biosynthesis